MDEMEQKKNYAMYVIGDNSLKYAYLQLLEKNVDILKPRIEQLEAFVNRFLDPEDLGYAVNKCFRDDAREALGRSRVESPSKNNNL